MCIVFEIGKQIGSHFLLIRFPVLNQYGATLRLEGQLKFAISFQFQSLQLGLQFFIIIIE